MIKERTWAETTSVANQDEYIASLDPLSLDSYFQNQFPQMNMKADTKALRQSISEIASSVFTKTRVGSLTVYEARAVTRDCSFLASALGRYWMPLNVAPGLNDIMLQASEISGESPSFVLAHYADRNPSASDRTRNFTGSKWEKLFIECLRVGNSAWGESIVPMLEARQMESICDPQFVPALEKIDAGLTKAKNAMLAARNIPPEFFTLVIEPFFPNLIVGGKKLKSASGVGGKNSALERGIYGVDVMTPDYHDYFDSNVDFLPLETRQIAKEISGQSLLTKVLYEGERLLESGEKDKAKKPILLMRQIMLNIGKFHNPHVENAERNFDYRKPNSTGSAGLRLEDLYMLGRIRYEAFSKIDNLYTRLVN